MARTITEDVFDILNKDPEVFRTIKSSTMSRMRAIVLHEAGGPEVLTIEEKWPKPIPQPGQVLIKVKAFGLNRSEMFTRQGHSPMSEVGLPRVLGIEAVGLVEESPDGAFTKNDIVATCMGGMGRRFDGGYAEYTCVPVDQVKVINPAIKISWEQLGALPEMMQTAWGSLFEALQIKKDDHLLIRGGTTSVGLAALALVKSMNLCASVGATTRKKEREAMLKENGADEVFIDDESIVKDVRSRKPDGYSKIIDLVGVTSLADTLLCAGEHGIVCVTGIVGGKWTFDNFNPHIIPTGVCLTTYSGIGSSKFQRVSLDEIAGKVVDGSLKIPIKAYPFNQIVEAHRAMEDNTAGAKIVVLV